MGFNKLNAASEKHSFLIQEISDLGNIRLYLFVC